MSIENNGISTTIANDNNNNNKIVDANNKLWGGRFTMDTAETLKKLNNSLPIDKRLYNEDIDGSKAYAIGLEKINVINPTELESILNGLECVRKLWLNCNSSDNGQMVFLPGDEDIHTVNERLLTEFIGPTAGKLHTGRSRNDQVITDMKLWSRKAIHLLLFHLYDVLKCMLNKSKEFIHILMPGYTHLQRAQPIRFSHWLLSHAFSLHSDCLRFMDTVKRVNVLPLGSGALAGNPFNIDRYALAKSLQFEMVTLNSMHAVSDRDFVIEFNGVASLTAMHLSRIAEDIILYTTKEFGFINLSESFSTGSSLMPQKRNPDSLELIRGICGDIFGKHCGFMMTMKGLPSTYNKDMQFDKSAMFSIFDQLIDSLKIIYGVLDTMTVNQEQCRNALSYDMLATDLAYYLVRKNVPFRTAHHLSGQVIALAEKSNRNVDEIELMELQKISTLFDDTVKNIWSFEQSVEQYTTVGGTAKQSVEQQIEFLTNFLLEHVK